VSGSPIQTGETGGGSVGGIPIEDVPPELLRAFGRGGNGPPPEALDEDELQRALERLADHQGQVDEMIQHEQSAAGAAAGDVNIDSAEIGASAPPVGGAVGSQRAEFAADESESSAATARTSSAEDGGGDHRLPADVGTGVDDDTLAAQLRELATKETDPVLRERYWEEYRKHKGI
jgi:hypothetical protein